MDNFTVLSIFYFILFIWAIMIRTLDWFNGKRFYTPPKDLEDSEPFTITDNGEVITDSYEIMNHLYYAIGWDIHTKMKNPVWLFDNWFFNNRWYSKKIRKTDNWTIIGIHFRWSDLYTRVLSFCFLGLELNIWFKVRERKDGGII